jgi:hypothetical protein
MSLKDRLISVTDQLDSNICAIIYSYLGSVEDIFNLSITNNDFYQALAENRSILRQYSIQSFRTLLLEFNLPFEGFVEVLGRTGAVISGTDTYDVVGDISSSAFLITFSNQSLITQPLTISSHRHPHIHHCLTQLLVHALTHWRTCAIFH